MNKTISGIMLTLLLAASLTLAFSIQLAKASDSLSADVSPKTGPPGTHVMVTVRGGTPNGTCRVSFDSVYVYTPTTPLSPTGGLNVGFTVPDVEPGEYNIKTLDVVSNTTIATLFTVLPPPPPPKAGVKAGDWIKYDYSVAGWPAGQPYPLWLKVEFLSVEETNSTIKVIMHMSNGTEQNATVPLDVVAGGQALGLSGFIIPANWTAGYSINIGVALSVTIAGETTRTYAGASRTVIYASFSQYGTYLNYYWDKETGVMVEASIVSGSTTGTAKVTETNLWEATPGFPIDPIILSVLIAIVIVIVITILLMRRKKRSAEPQNQRHNHKPSPNF